MDIIIRKAERKDIKQLAVVHVDSWKTTYKGIVDDVYLSTLKYEDREKLWHSVLSTPNYVWVAEVDHQVVGFISGGKERTSEFGYDGELYAIYILEEYQKRGIGKKLVEAFSNEMKEKGNYQSILVWVLSNNPSIAFYESLNPVKEGTTEVEIGKEIYEEIAFGWKDIDSLIEDIKYNTRA